MHVAVKQKPKALLSQLDLDMVEAFVLGASVQIEHSSELQALCLYHASSVRVPDLEVCYIKQVGCRKFLIVDFVEMIRRSQLEHVAVSMINETLARGEFQWWIMGTVCKVFAGHGPNYSRAETIYKTPEVRIVIILAQGNGSSEGRSMYDGDEAVQTCQEVIQHPQDYLSGTKRVSLVCGDPAGCSSSSC